MYKKIFTCQKFFWHKTSYKQQGLNSKKLHLLIVCKMLFHLQLLDMYEEIVDRFWMFQDIDNNCENYGIIICRIDR